MFFFLKKEFNNSCYSLDQPNKLIFLLDRKKEVMIAKKKKTITITQVKNHYLREK
jgi:hypothetical protein